ncbi:UNVERIFIED_CONTAM: ferrochelatase, partial [Salmonella enterica subsp. enterica serovar Weltevreden]
YAMSSFETVVVKVKQVMAEIGWQVPLHVLPPFYNHPRYIASLVASAQESLKWDYDHVLFSYHGIPLRQVLKVDPTGSHCANEPEG